MFLLEFPLYINLDQYLLLISKATRPFTLHEVALLINNCILEFTKINLNPFPPSHRSPCCIYRMNKYDRNVLLNVFRSL